MRLKDLVVNNKKTRKDEMALAIIAVFFMIIGILLVVYKPTIWVVSVGVSVTAGVLCVLFGIFMSICCLVRLSQNQK